MKQTRYRAVVCSVYVNKEAKEHIYTCMYNAYIFLICLYLLKETGGIRNQQNWLSGEGGVDTVGFVQIFKIYMHSVIRSYSNSEASILFPTLQMNIRKIKSLTCPVHQLTWLVNMEPHPSLALPNSKAYTVTSFKLSPE